MTSRKSTSSPSRTDLLRTQQATTYSSEIEFHRLSDRALGSGGLAAFRVGG